MRPLRLEVSGLTCFREKVEIDFSTLTLVAIEGPTGAGKSSLLDAMILALYGVVPRMGARNLGELIAHGRSALAVTFDFEVRGARWRVTRTLSRNRPSQAILSELVVESEAAVEKRKASGVQEVQRAVREVLGIDVAAFQQSVILPQGRFQEFLQSTPADRRKILSELLGLQVYALMRAKAAETATRLAAEVDTLGKQLAGDLSLASETLIADLELQLGVASSERDQWRAAVAMRHDALTEVERAAGRCLELKAIDDALVALQEREPAIIGAAERARRAREVAPVMPLVAAAEAARERAAAFGARLAGVTTRVQSAQGDLEGALEAGRDAENAALAIPGYRARIALLDEARARFEQREELAARLGRLVAEVSSTGAARELARLALDAAEGELAAGRERLGALERDAAPAVDPEVIARWEALREVASGLQLARPALAREREALAAVRALATTSEAELDHAERERKHKEHAELVAEEALEAARQALSQAEHAARVLLVREHLHAGEPCPVCEQPVAVVPAGGAPAEVAELREKVGAQKIAVETARAAAERAHAKVAEARARHGEATRKEAEVTARMASQAELVREHEARLEALVGAGEGKIEDRYRAGLDTLAERTRRAAAHVAALQDLRLAVERGELGCERRRGELGQLVARVGELERTRRELTGQLAEIEATLAGLASADPRKERASLERVIANLEAGRGAAASRVTAAREALAAVEAEERTVVELGAAARDEHEAARGALAEALSELRLASVEAARGAALSAETLAAIASEVHAHHLAREAQLARRAEVVRELGPLRAGPDDVAAARAALEAGRGKAEEAASQAAVLGERLRQAKEQLARAGGVRAEHEARARQLEVYRRVADDLKTNHFQEFLLEEVVADLVRGASERLFRLSGGRYRLAAEPGGGFQVQDLEHAGERRSTDTLSGGETFLASLAMALELSEQIRAKAGRVDLDCIFIDEGFGALDPETLETVTEAVEGLQRPGRLVGIITHVAELAQRMPERLVVEKSLTGSSVRTIMT